MSISTEDLKRQFAQKNGAAAPKPTLSDIAIRFKSVLDKAKIDIIDLKDLVAQYEGSPKIQGIVLRVFTDRFKVEDFPVGQSIRVVRGAYSGSVGTVESELNDSGEAYVRFAGATEPVQMMIVRAGENPEMILNSGTESETTVYDPQPWEYRLGAKVLVDGDRRDIVQTVDSLGAISYRDDETDEVTFLFVGKNEFVVPASVKAGSCFVLLEGKMVEMKVPRQFEINAGDVVSVDPQTMEIISSGGLPMFGDTVTFEQLLPDGLAEVTLASTGGTKVVYSTASLDGVKKGARVSLDSSGSCILKVLPKSDVQTSGYTDKTGVSWSDIGGQEEAKRAMQEAIENPVKYKELYAFYKKKPVKGILLYGPPGTGKTMFGKAAVTATQELYGVDQGAETAFIYVKGPEILSQWVGAAEQKIRGMFSAAREHYATHGFPATIFIDEADAILPKRGSVRSSDVDKTIVPMFLAEMDGLEDNHCLMILATNKPDSLDPAVTREGRVDRKIKVGRPGFEAAKDIFKLYMGNLPLSKKLKVEDAVQVAVETLFSEEIRLCDVAYKGGEVEPLTLGKIASGAMIAGIADMATSIAISRDMVEGTMSGVTSQDIIDAVIEIAKQNADANHDDDIQDLACGRQVIGITKVLA